MARVTSTESQSGGTIPPDARRIIGVRNLMFLTEAGRIIDAAAECDARVLVIKGPAITQLAHGELSRRAFDDLDIAVDPDRITPLRDRLIETCGYTLEETDGALDALHGIDKHVRVLLPEDKDRLAVEMHRRLTQAWHPRVAGFERLWRRRQEVAIAGRTIPTLGMADTLVYHCVHAANHGWGRPGWTADLDGLVRRAGGKIDWDDVTKTARRWRTRRMLHTGLLLAARTHATPVPEPAMNEAERDRAAGRLADRVERRWASDKPPWPVGWELFRFRLASIDHPADRLRLIKHQFFTPTVLETRTLRLPRPLWFLYAAIRPARLIVTRLRRKRGD